MADKTAIQSNTGDRLFWPDPASRDYRPHRVGRYRCRHPKTASDRLVAGMP
jgi:hypothetical protein